MIAIRVAHTGDLESLGNLFDQYRIFYHQTSDLSSAIEFLRERMEKKQSVIFVAEKQGKLVGFTQLYPIFSSVGLKRTWLLNDLFVHADARKQGVGELLLDAAKNYGVETDSNWLMLQTGAENYTAQSLYEKNGWRKISDFFYELPLR